MSSTLRLETAINTVCPVTGVSVGTPGDPATVRIDFDPAATDAQKAAAQAVVAAFDWSDAAQVAWEEDQKPERKSLRQSAAQAVADNDAFLALVSPTNAQTLAQVRRLTQQNRVIIRRLIQLD